MKCTEADQESSGSGRLDMPSMLKASKRKGGTISAKQAKRKSVRLALFGKSQRS